MCLLQNRQESMHVNLRYSTKLPHPRIRMGKGRQRLHVHMESQIEKALCKQRSERRRASV